MFYSVKVRILCILLVLFSLVHSSQGDANTIELLKRIKKQLIEFKLKYENEQQRVRDFVSLTLNDLEEGACYNATIETFLHKNDHDPFGNLNILSIELKLASLLSGSGKLSEPTVGPAENQGCDCLPNSCTAAILSGNGPGIYKILISDKVVSVFCDAFGRMMIQHQIEGPANFFKRTWVDFKNGFGAPQDQFWLGLKYVHLLTSLRRYELHIVVRDFKNVTTQYVYDNFHISDESDMYRIKQLGGYSGGDDNRNLLQNHINAPFSTSDKDNNGRLKEGNCALRYSCGWWYLNEPAEYCSRVILNQPVRTNDSEAFYSILKWGKDLELQEVTMYIH